METLSWEKLEQYIGETAPVLLAMGGTRNVRIGYEPSCHKLFLRVPLSSDEVVPASPFAEIELEARQEINSTARLLEIFTFSNHLFRDFHQLAGLLTEDFESANQTAVGAFLAVVDRWRELTTKRKLLTEDEQLGLMGELLVLEALINKHGPDAVESWTGRMKDLPERHDFRIVDIDLEIKTTRLMQRQHVIHGLRQLAPSSDHNLFLVSIMVESAGLKNGVSLVDRVKFIRNILVKHPVMLESFEVKLKASKYFDNDDAHYRTRFILSNEIHLISVDDKFPRLIPSTLCKAIGVDLATRIDQNVIYRVNVDGLGESLLESDKAYLFGEFTRNEI